MLTPRRQPLPCTYLAIPHRANGDLFPLRKLQMDIPYLLIHIDILHPRRQPRRIFALRIPIIAYRCLLPPRRLLLAQRLPSHTIEHIGALRRKPLEVVRRVVVP
jgi:hypothetical protein